MRPGAAVPRAGAAMAAPGAARLLAAWLALSTAAPALSAQWVVGPGQSLAQALQRAADGDEVQLPAGDYRGQVGVILQKRLTLRGVGGRPVLHAEGQSAEGKAILVVRDGDVHIENIEFRGARVADRNGAGIRFERGRLRVLRCAFFDNENGILTANFGDAELEVADSEFGNAPAATPLPHLIYVGRIARFTLSGSRVRGGNEGHLVKSRALENFVRYNELVDGPGGRASYELEFPNGGLAVVVGNTIGQSGSTTNPVILSFASEGADDRARQQVLLMSHNTLVNDGPRPAVFVRVADPAPGQAVEARFFNNLFVGLGLSTAGWGDVAQGNFPLPRAALRDADAFAFGLAPGSWLKGRAVQVPDLRGQSIRPEAQFAAPAGTRPLPASLRLSPGAIQLD
jgi:hypothetical protein